MANRIAVFRSDNQWHDLGTGPVTLATPPSTPTGVSATPGAAQATVSWTASASNGGAPILEYVVTASPGGQVVTSETTMATLSGLTPGTPYSFTVAARNAAGTSAASAPTAPVTPTAPVVGGGTTYYVSTTGSNAAAGSLAAPWATLAFAFAQLQPGDTLLVRGGHYVENVVYPVTNNATAANPILVQNYPSERPVLEGFLHLSGISFWTLDGLNVMWPAGGDTSTHMVKLGSGDSWHLTNAEIWGANSFACLHVHQTPLNFLVDYCYIHDNLGPHGANNQDHCIYLDPSPSGYGTVERNILTNSPFGRGVKVALPSSSDPAITGNAVIRYNTMYNNGGPSNIQLSYTASNNTMYRNLMQKPRSVTTTNIRMNSVTGTNNVAHDNVGWESSGVVPPSSANFTDAGGNFMANPQFVNFSNSDNHAWNVASTLDWHPQNPAVQAYGRYAP